MPIFYSPHSDLFLSALTMAMLLAGVTCIAISLERNLPRPVPSWRYLGAALLILASREWFAVIGISSTGFSGFYAVSAIQQAMASICVLLAARLECGPSRSGIKTVHMAAALSLALIVGVFVEQILNSRGMASSHAISTTLFFLIKALFALSVLLLVRCTWKGGGPPPRAIGLILLLLLLYSVVMLACLPPGLPVRGGFHDPYWDGVFIWVWLFRVVLAFVLGSLLWNAYTLGLGVAGRIRWLPLQFMYFAVLAAYLFVFVSTNGYKGAVRENLAAAAANAAAAMDAAALSASAPLTAVAERDLAFRAVRRLKFRIGHTGMTAEIDALAVDAGTGAIAFISNPGRTDGGGRWSRSPHPFQDVWREAVENGVAVRGFGNPRLEPVMAVAPVTDGSGEKTGAAVLGLSSIDLSLDLYRFRRFILLFMTSAFFVLLLMQHGQNRAWLASHSSDRAEALKTGALGNDLTGVMITMGGKIVNANRRFSEMVGAERDDLAGLDVNRVIAAEAQVDRQLLDEAMDRAARDGSSLLELTARAVDGRRVHLMLYARKLDSDSRDRHLVWDTIDISRMKEMEEEVRSSRDHLQMILDTIPDGIFIKDSSGRYRMANQAFCELMGYDSAGQFIGKMTEEIRPGEVADSIRHDAMCIERPGVTLISDQTFIIDGETRYYEVSKTMKREGDGDKDFIIVGTIHDVNARRRAEDAVKAEHHFLVQLLNTIPMLVCVVDRDRIVRICDEDFRREAGAESPSELIGRPYDEITPFGTPDPEEDAEIMARGGCADQEFESSGRNFILRRSAMSSPDGDVTGIVKTFWDVTALVAATKDAKKAERAKAAFLANMSHELRTPMNGIVGMADLIARQDAVSPVQRFYAEVIIKSAKTLQVVLDEVMGVATMDDSKKRFAVSNTPFPLLTVVEESVEVAGCIMEAWRGELSLSYDLRLAPIHVGDSGMVRQVLIQVLTHCSRMTADKRLSLDVAPAAVVSGPSAVAMTVSFRPKAGMDSSGLENMFKRPHDAASRNSTSNLGMFNDRIGLPLAWRLIRAMDGALSAGESAAGEIVCRVVLPLRADQSSQQAIIPPALKGMRVILAMTDSAGLAAARSCLEYAGCMVADAADGDDLLARVRAAGNGGGGFDMLLLDSRFATASGLASLVGEAARDGGPDVVLMLKSHSVQSLPVLDDPRISSMLMPPLCPTELWARTEEVWAGRTGSGRPRAENRGDIRNSTRVTRLVNVPVDVLLAEDNTVNQTVQMGLLKRLGCNPTLARNGREAVEKILGGGEYDLIFMDCMMPLMDGYEATSHIRQFERANPGAKRNIIVALTANTVKGDKERCLASGMDDYVAKPVTLDIMRDAILRHCPGRAEPAEAE